MLVELMQPSVREEHALQAIARAVHALELDPQALTRDDALRVLEEVAAGGGLVGVTARFARSRLLLKLARDHLGDLG